MGDLGERPAGARGQGFDLGPHVVALEALGVEWWGLGEAKGREMHRKGEGGGRMSSQPGSLAFSWIGSKQGVYWEHAQSCLKGPASGSLKGRREMVRGAEKEEALSRWPSPMVGDVKRGTPPPPRCAEISLGILKCPIPKATNAFNPSLD